MNHRLEIDTICMVEGCTDQWCAILATVDGNAVAVVCQRHRRIDNYTVEAKLNERTVVRV